MKENFLKRYLHVGVMARIRERVLRHGQSPRIKNIRNKYIRHGLLLLNSLKWYVCHPAFFFDSGLYYTCVEVSVTTNCTLKCKKCVHFIPRFGARPYTPADVIVGDLKKLLEAVDYIDEVRILGGEPLLHPELHKIVATMLESNKTGFVEIVTNGTIVPGREILDLFPNDKLNIYVSNYGKLSAHKEDFEKLKAEGISVYIGSEDAYWFDHGNMEYQNRSLKELKKQFSRCIKQRCIIVEGKLHNCCIAAYGSELGVIPLKDGEYVNLRESKDTEELKKQLRIFNKRKYHVSCNYCYDGTDLYQPISAAEQLK